MEPGSEPYALQVLTKQVNFFGPVPLKYQEIAHEEALDILAMVINHVKETQIPKPFIMAEDPELSAEDRDFLCKIMRFDPRDTPTAVELLEDHWFKELCMDNGNKNKPVNQTDGDSIFGKESN